MIVARAPGKLVALGEYAVLDGAPALVLAVDRYAEAAIDAERGRRVPADDASPRTSSSARFAPGEPSGAALVDLVTAAAPLLAVDGRRSTRKRSSPAGAKLGLGSSAAVLCAWAGAFAAFARSAGAPVPEPTRRGADRAAPAVPGREGQRTRRRGELYAAGRLRSASRVPVCPKLVQSACRTV